INGERHIAAVRCHLCDVDLAHLALEAVDHEGFKVGTVVPVGGVDAPDVTLGDAVVECNDRIELLLVHRIRVQMILFHALDANRERLEPVDERNAEMQAWSGYGAELAETGDDGALILTHGEERRHKIESKQRD